MSAGRARRERAQAPARASETGRLHSGCVKQTPQSQNKTEQNAITRVKKRRVHDCFVYVAKGEGEGMGRSDFYFKLKKAFPI